LKSQNISNLLAKVGDNDIPSIFMGKMFRNLGTERTLVYDLTSFSNYSHLINLLEYGYIRDDSNLPQVNLSMIVDKEKGIPGWRNPEDVFKERAKEMAGYYSWEKIDDHFRINIKKNAVSQRVNRMGKFFLFYYGERDWMECLTVYRERDIVEKGFKIMKNDIQSLPLSTNKYSTTKGFIFICFIGLIIRMKLLSLMRETTIIEDYTVESLLLELEKIRKIELQNGEIIVTELTRKQKEIMEKLNLCA